MTKSLAALLFAAALIAAPPASAQGTPASAQGSVADMTDMQALREAAKADKKALVAKTLMLTDAEAKKFWPIYDSYQRALDVAVRQRNVVVVDLVGLQKPLSDPYARDLSKELIAADEAEIRARRTLQNKVMKALPPKKAARYMQLESKIRAVQAYDIAVAIPLIR
ncbi:MAG: hypothetical protein ABI724_09020 [Betaproteobacteria bacterium]